MAGKHLDACLKLLAHGRRREIIHRLRDEPDGVTTVDDLVESLYTGESMSDTGRRPSRERLVIELSHTHLPKLTGHGVAEHDATTGTVRYRPDQQVEAMLDSLPGEVPQPAP